MISFVLQVHSQSAPYSGSAEDCNGFLLQCSLTLEMQLHRFSTERAKISFILLLLSGWVLQWVNATQYLTSRTRTSSAAASLSIWWHDVAGTFHSVIWRMKNCMEDQSALQYNPALQNQEGNPCKLIICDDNITPADPEVVHIVVPVDTLLPHVQLGLHVPWWVTLPALKSFHHHLSPSWFLLPFCVHFYHSSLYFWSSATNLSSKRGQVKLITGKTLSGAICHCVGPVKLQIGCLPVENIKLLVLEKSTNGILLGHPWLFKYNPVLSWSKGDILMWGVHCFSDIVFLAVPFLVSSKPWPSPSIPPLLKVR